jgi:hypothetical protein
MIVNTILKGGVLYFTGLLKACAITTVSWRAAFH